MDAENDSSQLMNISDHEIEDQETANVKKDSLFCEKCKQCPEGCMDFVTRTLLQKITAETISTFILVFVTCGSSILDHGSHPLVSELGGSIASGLIVTVMIYSVGHISGAHMNPAVTISFATVRHFPWKQVPLYIIAQLGGSITASFALRVMFKPVTNTGVTTPSGTALQALAMEFVVSFVLMFVTSAVATDSSAGEIHSISEAIICPYWKIKRSIAMKPLFESLTMQIGELAGIAVGSMVMISSIFAGPISGGSMNPARSLGPTIASNNYKAIWVYFVGPIAGTLMGACSYSIIRLTEKPLQAISLRQTSFLSLGRDLKVGDSGSAVRNDLI